MNYLELSQAISTQRKSAGLSQRALAEMTGISRATISAFENGRAPDLGIRKLILIARCLQLELTLRDQSPFPTYEELRDEFSGTR